MKLLEIAQRAVASKQFRLGHLTVVVTSFVWKILELLELVPPGDDDLNQLADQSDRSEERDA